MTIIEYPLRFEWIGMRRMAVSGAIVLLALSAGPVVAQIAVSPNVQVSKAWGDREHEETVLAADPNDANHLVASSMVLDPVTSVYYILAYASFDAGVTWKPTLEVRRGYLTGDPAVVFGNKGEVYFVCLGFPIHPDGTPGGVTLMYRSLDGGRSWNTPTSLPMSDRPFMAVDRSNGTYRGRLYLHTYGGPGLPDIPYQPFDATPDKIARSLLVYHSDDGVTFPDPVRLITREEEPLRRAGNNVVLSDGTYIGVVGVGAEQASLSDTQENLESEKNLVLKTYASSDGGATFSSATRVSSWHYPTDLGFATNPAIAADVSTGPFHDRVYVAWADDRSGRTQILLSHSDNMGRSWSSPIIVNDDKTRTGPNGKTNGPDDFQPMIDVNKDGIVGVVWYDRRDDPDNTDWSEYFAASLDGGDTFLPNVRVSEHAFVHDYSKPVTLNTGVQLGLTNGRSGILSMNIATGRAYQGAGETQGLAASADGAFHPVWTDNRTGIPQIWTASIAVQGRALKNGSMVLEGLTDVTRDIAVDLTNPKYNPTTHTISLEAHLVNNSKAVLHGPVKVRAVTLSSRLGPIEIANADNGGNQPNAVGGAVWDFTPLIPNGGWKPDVMLAPRRLEFHVGKEFPDVDERAFLQFVHLGAKVYAREIQ